MSNSKDASNSDYATDSVRPELVEGFSADALAAVLKLYEEIFQKFDNFCKNEYKYSDKNRGQLFECLLLAQILEHATLLRALTESQQRLYAPLAAVFRGLFESAVKLMWLLLEHPEVNRHKQLDRDSIHDDWMLKVELNKIGALSTSELKKEEVELTNYIKEIDSKYTLLIPKKEKLKFVNITKDIAPYFRESKRDLYAIYRAFSGSLHGNLEVLGRQYIKNNSIYLFSHDPARFIDIYRFSSEILESILQLFRAQAKLNPSTSSGRMDTVSSN